MTKFHRTTQALNLGLALAEGIIELRKRLKDAPPECLHEIDVLSQMAGYFKIEVEHRDDH